METCLLNKSENTELFSLLACKLIAAYGESSKLGRIQGKGQLISPSCTRKERKEKEKKTMILITVRPAAGSCKQKSAKSPASTYASLEMLKNKTTQKTKLAKTQPEGIRLSSLCTQGSPLSLNPFYSKR